MEVGENSVAMSGIIGKQESTCWREKREKRGKCERKESGKRSERRGEQSRSAWFCSLSRDFFCLFEAWAAQHTRAGCTTGVQLEPIGFLAKNYGYCCTVVGHSLLLDFFFHSGRVYFYFLPN